MKQTIKRLLLTYRDELVDRISWLVRLRWLAAVSVCTTILVVTTVFDLLVDRYWLLAAGCSIFICNVVYSLYFKWLLAHPDLARWYQRIARLANLQISVDLIILTVLIYLAGGVENPLFFYFIFHMIIASILLDTLDSYLQATLAVILFNLMLILESTGTIPHQRLFPFFEVGIYHQPVYLLGFSVVFTSTIYLSVYMATSITGKLRQREEELVELKDSFEQTNRRLTELHEHRSRFILKVEHELKTPLAAIQSLIAVILTTFSNQLPAKVRDLLGRAEKRTHILFELIKELLELSRLQSVGFSFEFQPVALEPLVSRQCELLRAQAEEKGIHLEKAIPPDLPAVEGDPRAMEQVVMNLLSNAVKYTETGKVRVEAAGEGNLVKLAVSDTGIGMAPDEVPRVFEEFFRGIEAKEKYEGTGLGLSIVWEIVDSHGGRIEVESEKGKGSTFTVLLPRASL